MDEGLRTDSLMLGPVRISQLLAALLAAGSLIALIVRARRKKRLRAPAGIAFWTFLCYNVNKYRHAAGLRRGHTWRTNIIITDSSCDLPDDIAAQLGVKVVPLSLTLGGREYLNTTDARGIPNKELYARLRAGEVSRDLGGQRRRVRRRHGTGDAGRARCTLHRLFPPPFSATCQVGANVGREMMEKYPRPQGLHGRFPLCLFGAGPLRLSAGAEKARGHGTGGPARLCRRISNCTSATGSPWRICNFCAAAAVSARRRR